MLVSALRRIAVREQAEEKFKEFSWKIHCVRFASRDIDRFMEYANCYHALLEVKVEHNIAAVLVGDVYLQWQDTGLYK